MICINSIFLMTEKGEKN